MVNFAALIHKKYKRGCLDVLNSAIKLKMPCRDLVYILYCFNKAFKAPFLDAIEYTNYVKGKKFGELMEELLVARDVIEKNMDRETAKLERKLSEWNKDINEDQQYSY